MTQKLVLLIVSSLLAWFSAQSAAQDQGASQEQVEAARALVREGARQIVRDELMLTDKEGSKFWPLYDKYRSEMLEVEDTYVDLLREFLQMYYGFSLTDDDAKEYVDTYFDIQGDILKIRKRYVRRFRKILPDIKVMRLYQIENKIRAEVDAALAITVPLAGPS